LSLFGVFVSIWRSQIEIGRDHCDREKCFTGYLLSIPDDDDDEMQPTRAVSFNDVVPRCSLGLQCNDYLIYICQDNVPLNGILQTVDKRWQVDVGGHRLTAWLCVNCTTV